MITELTEEQRKMMPVYVDKWTKIGLSCEPVKDYEETINLFYEKVLNKKRPAKIILSPSPLHAWEQLWKRVSNQVLDQVLRRELSVSGQVWRQRAKEVVWLQVWRRIENQGEILSQVWNEVSKEATKEAREKVSEQISEKQLWKQVTYIVGEIVWEQVGEGIAAQVQKWGYLVMEQVRERLSKQWVSMHVWEEVRRHVRDGVDFGDYAFYDYFNQVLDIQYPEDWPLFKRTIELGFVYAFFDDVCIVSERPEQISMKNGILHNETGMAVRYGDGWGIYRLNGVRVTKEIVETPADKLDPEILLKETNAEVRREIVGKIGVERLEKKLKPRVLDRWGDYELHDYSQFFRRMRCKPVYLKMKNPSIGVWHYEGVNINELEAPTCQAALKWRLNGIDFKPIQIT